MEIIIKRGRILSLQHKLKKRLTELLPNTAIRKVLIPNLNEKVKVNYNVKLMK